MIDIKKIIRCKEIECICLRKDDTWYCECNKPKIKFETTSIRKAKEILYYEFIKAKESNTYCGIKYKIRKLGFLKWYGSIKYNKIKYFTFNTSKKEVKKRIKNRIDLMFENYNRINNNQKQ